MQAKTIARAAVPPLFIALAALAGTSHNCFGDYQPGISLDGTRFTYNRSVPDASTDTSNLYLWSFDADAGWQLSAFTTLSSTRFVNTQPDPLATTVAGYTGAGAPSLFVAQADGGYATLPVNSDAGLGSTNGEAAALSADASVIADAVANARSSLLVLQADGGYERVATDPFTNPKVNAAGDLVVFVDSDGGGTAGAAYLAALTRTGNTFSTPAPIPTDGGFSTTAFDLSPGGSYLAYCNSSFTLPPSVLQRDAGWAATSAAAVDGGCSSVVIAETGTLYAIGLNAPNLVRSDPPYSTASVVATSPHSFSNLRTDWDGGAVVAVASTSLPDGGFDSQRVLYLGPAALSAGPGVALPNATATLPPPGVPLLSAQLRGQPTDTETVSAIAVQLSGSLVDAGVSLVHLYLDPAGLGLPDAGAIELGAAKPPSADGGPITWTGLSLQLGRVADPHATYPVTTSADGGTLSATLNLLATVEAADGGAGSVTASLDPTLLQASTDSTHYAIHPLGAPVVGATLTLAAADAGTDGGADAGFDGGLPSPDAGPDAGVPDAGTTDAGAPDAGNTDAGNTDAGSDAGVTVKNNSSGCGCTSGNAEVAPLALFLLAAFRMRRRRATRASP